MEEIHHRLDPSGPGRIPRQLVELQGITHNVKELVPSPIGVGVEFLETEAIPHPAVDRMIHSWIYL